jgi:hypothetical protein
MVRYVDANHKSEEDGDLNGEAPPSRGDSTSRSPEVDDRV